MRVLHLVTSLAISFYASLTAANVLSMFGYNHVPPEPVPVFWDKITWTEVAVACLAFIVSFSAHFENVQVSFPGVEARVRAIERKQKKWDKKRTRLMNFI